MYFDLLDARSETHAGPAPSFESEEQGPDARVCRKPVTLSLFAARTQVAKGQRLEVAIRLSVDMLWHVNSHSPLQEHLVPTAVSLGTNAIATACKPVYPEGTIRAFGSDGESLSVYEGDVWIRAPIEVLPDAPQGAYELAYRITTQACNDRICLTPQEVSITFPVEVVDQSPRHTAARHSTLFERLGVTPD
jgi:hypothetical protein